MISMIPISRRNRETEKGITMHTKKTLATSLVTGGATIQNVLVLRDSVGEMRTEKDGVNTGAISCARNARRGHIQEQSGIVKTKNVWRLIERNYMRVGGRKYLQPTVASALAAANLFRNF
jgi:hypothetical protein